MGFFSGGGGCWNLQFSRPLNDWEMELIERFILTIQGKVNIFLGMWRIGCCRKSQMIWNFLVKSLYGVLQRIKVLPRF